MTRLGGAGITINELPPVEPTLLQKAGTFIFDSLDAPGNAARSIAVGDAINALKSLTPIIKSDRISGEQVLNAYGIDSDDDTTAGFFANLAVEIALDPLLFVNAVGAPTKLGKAASQLMDAKRAARASRAIGKQVKRAGNKTILPEQMEEFFKLRKEAYREAGGRAARKGGETMRSAVTIGIPFTKIEKQIGSLDNLNRMRVFKSPKVVAAEHKVLRLQRERDELVDAANALAPGDAKNRVTEKIATLNEKIDMAKVGNDALASRLGLDRSFPLLEGAKNFFNKNLRFTSSDEQIEAFKDITRVEESGAQAKLRIQVENMTDEFDNLRQARGEDEAAFMQRMINLAENPYVANPNAVPTAKAAALGAVKEKWAPRFKKITEQFKKAQAANDQQKMIRVADRADKMLTQFDTSIGRAKSKVYELETQLKQFEKIAGEATSAEIKWVDDYVRSIEQFVPLAQDLGIKDIEILKSSAGMVKFLPRLLTPEAIKLKRKDADLYARVFNEFNTMFSGSNRRKLMPEFSIPNANRMLKEKYDLNFNVFKEDDILGTLATRRAEQHKVLNRAAAINAFTDMYGTSVGNSEHFVRADRVFEMFNMNPKKAPAILDSAGKPLLKNNEIQYKWIPKAKVDELHRVRGFISNDLADEKTLNWAFQQITMINRIYQGALTAVFPAFHARNAINNIAMNRIAGITLKEQKRTMLEMYRLQREVARGGVNSLNKADAALWQELNQFGAVRAGVFQDYMEGIRRGATPEVIARNLEKLDYPLSSAKELFTGKKTPKRREQFNIGTGSAFGRFLEENARGAHYLAMKRKGMSPLEAARSVNKYLFDPTRITEFERKNLRPLFLFYTWTRNNIPLMAKTMITNPRVGSLYTKLTGTENEEVPQWMNRGFAFKAPPFMGKDQYFGSLGLGIEDLHITNVNSADPDWMSQVQRLGQNVASRLTPVIRAPLEALSGNEFFSGRSTNEKTLREFLLSAAPTSRFTGTARRAISDVADGDWGSFLANMFTGIKTYKADPKAVAIDVGRRRLLGTGKFKRGGIPIRKRKFKDDEQAKQWAKEFAKLVRDQRKD